MGETERPFLLDVEDFRQASKPTNEFGRRHVLVVFQEGLELEIAAKMRLQDGLVIAYDKDDSFDSGGRCFFDRELDERLPANREHFLGDCLSRGKHPRPEASRGDHCLHDFLGIGHVQAIFKKRERETPDATEFGCAIR